MALKWKYTHFRYEEESVMERKKIIEDLIASIDVQTFENMVLLYFADIGIFAINSDMNIFGNIKYYDMYN